MLSYSKKSIGKNPWISHEHHEHDNISGPEVVNLVVCSIGACLLPFISVLLVTLCSTEKLFVFQTDTVKL